MKNSKDKKAVVLGVTIGVGAIVAYFVMIIGFFGLIFDLIFKGDSYYKADKNETPELVEKYLDNYLYEKYGKRFELTYVSKYKRDFCPGGGFECFGVYYQDDMYSFVFTAKDEKGENFTVDYYCAYYNGSTLNKERVIEHYDVVLESEKLDDILKNTYDLYYIKPETSISLVIYDKDFDIDKYKEIITINIDSKLTSVLVSDEDTYNSLVNLKSTLYYPDSVMDYIKRNLRYTPIDNFSEVNDFSNYILLNSENNEQMYTKSK